MSKVLTPDPGTLASEVVPNFEQKVESLTGEQRAHWELTGELPQNSDAVDSTDTSASSPDTSDASQEAESGAAPDPAIEEQPKSGETPQEKSERKKRNDYARYVREKTRADMLERQLAELRTAPAPVADPKKVPPQAEAPKERPKRPRIQDYTDGNLYDADMDKYEADKDAWDSRQIEERVSGVKTQISAVTQRDAKLAKAREKYTDFEQVAWNKDVTASWTMLHSFEVMDDGRDLQYLVAKNPKLAAQIAELTKIPGEDQIGTFTDFQQWIKGDVNRAILFGEKLAMAKAELSKLGKSTPAAQQRQPSRSRPTSEVTVEARGAPAIDGYEDAIKTNDYEAYERIANQRDIAERTGRR